MLAYSNECGDTDLPLLQNLNWSRRLNGIPMNNPQSDTTKIPPGSSTVLFDGIRTTGLDTTSVLDLVLKTNQTSLYQIDITAGDGAFRTPRTISGLTTCTVTINNNVVATFNFTGATFTGVVPGDTLWIEGTYTNDFGVFSFNSLNSGTWQVLSISGSTIQAVRPPGVIFNGATEVVTIASPSEVQVFSAAGVQVGDMFEIQGAFSQASFRTYQVLQVTPTSVQFNSTLSLPVQSGVTYPDPTIYGQALQFYTDGKRLFYLETDQNITVQVNGDPNQYNKVQPIFPGNKSKVGYFHTFGLTYAVTVNNTSVNVANITFFSAE